MSIARSVKISLAFVGLLVGAGFATGQEAIQYFVSFGRIGIWGAVLAGLLMVAAGVVILQLGSYFLAEEHNMVFRHVSHPVVSRALDVSITLTLFAVGFVMLAGAGSTLNQQFGIPAWLGAGVMTLLVMVTGLLDVDKVSNIISAVTPLIVVAVVVAFVHTLTTLPADLSGLESIATLADSPVRPWWLSGLNYTGMALLLGVSMCLVIGGTVPDPREAGLGGFLGGLLFSVLLLMNCVTLYLSSAQTEGAEVPMLKIFDSIHPVASLLMVIVVFLMIYNTAIGMFYALGRRLTASRPQHYRPVFLLACLLGYAVSFAGFGNLMSYAYPAIGYVGMAMILIVCTWWLKERGTIVEETGRRFRMRALLTLRTDPERRFSRRHAAMLHDVAEESNVEPATITGAIELEVERMLEPETQQEDESLTR
ncbi:MAG TPA: hypothetical protein VK122_03655 [Brachybacterium sp.]|nr:hypothetical protein [Brachybacterium sp.]